VAVEQETIELPEDVDPEDELGQLYALHSGYLKSTKGEIILGGQREGECKFLTSFVQKAQNSSMR
jgi:hypothetical protein